MKLSEVPENLRVYVIKMSSGTEYVIDGRVKAVIMEAKTNFIQLESGSVINKAFITEIRIDRDETRNNVLKNKSSLALT
jgi:DNA-binding LytR/AlgR family response regulator